MKKILILVASLIIIITSVLMLKNVNATEPESVIDNRVLIIDEYYKERDMPLYGYGSKIIEVADKYSLDWRLLAAISIRETSGGKHMCKNIKAQNNPFGWGSCKIGFKSIEESIEVVGFKLGNLPVYKGKTTRQKLYHYNGTVVPTYPDEVITIMNNIKTLD